jgi:hypothetical protein
VDVLDGEVPAWPATSAFAGTGSSGEKEREKATNVYISKSENSNMVGRLVSRGKKTPVINHRCRRLAGVGTARRR